MSEIIVGNAIRASRFGAARVRGEVAALPLNGVIDSPPSARGSTRKWQKADADIARVDAKLGNEKFVANAPEEVVEGEKEKREKPSRAKRKSSRRWSGSRAPRKWRIAT